MDLTANETLYLRVASGKRLCYAKYGDHAGTPLLYFHGWPSSRLQAHSLHALAKELGVTIYAPDRPGIGQSDHVEGRRLSDWPALVEEMINALKLPAVHVMGVSGGGPYAIATACALDDRVLSTSIVSGAPPLAEIQNRRAMIWPYRFLLRARPFLPAITKPVLPLARWAASKRYDQPPLSWYTNTLSIHDRHILYSHHSDLFALYSFRESLVNGAPGLLTDADAYTQEWNLDFSAITKPIHFWHGKDDQNIPIAMAEHLAAQFPKATTNWLEEEGHYTVAISHSRAILACALGRH